MRIEYLFGHSFENTLCEKYDTFQHYHELHMEFEGRLAHVDGSENFHQTLKENMFSEHKVHILRRSRVQFVGYEGETPIGIMGFSIMGNDAWICDLYVEPEFRAERNSTVSIEASLDGELWLPDLTTIDGMTNRGVSVSRYLTFACDLTARRMGLNPKPLEHNVHGKAATTWRDRNYQAWNKPEYLNDKKPTALFEELETYLKTRPFPGR